MLIDFELGFASSISLAHVYIMICTVGDGGLHRRQGPRAPGEVEGGGYRQLARREKVLDAC